MDSKPRSVIVNEDDNRKLEIYTHGDLDTSPSGIAVFAADANNTLRILKQDDAGNLNVNVQAGGAGGGVAQTQVRDSAGAWADVGYSAGKQNMPVYLAGSAASSSLQIIGITNTIRIGDIPGSVAVYFSPSNPAVNATFAGTMAVYFDQSEPVVKVKNETNGTISVKFNSEPTVVSSGKQGVTTRPLIMNTDGAIKVYDVVNGTMTVNSGTGTLAVRFSDEPYVVTEGKYGATKIATIHNTDGALKIYDIAQGTVTVTGITNTIGIYLDTWRQTGAVRVGQVDGTVAVYFSQSNPKVNLGVDIINCAHTASIANAGGSVSGSTSGVSVSGVQIIAPEANRVVKVYAFSIMSTAAVNLTSKFTNGSGGSPVELWRVAMISPTGGVAGANLAVTPPGYLFATPSGATLCIVNDSASLIHYSVAYFKESA
jgi:hypothetical protein